MPCQKYVRKIVEYNKTNTYTLYISKISPHVPLRYEMVGYDDLLTSHYDHYILDYITFTPWTFNFSVFRIPAGKRFVIFVFAMVGCNSEEYPTVAMLKAFHIFG